nr:hypothetical protein [Tanacetum cinerariifolium]
DAIGGDSNGTRIDGAHCDTQPGAGRWRGVLGRGQASSTGTGPGSLPTQHAHQQAGPYQYGADGGKLGACGGYHSGRL